MADSSEKQARERTLTEKGEELYENNKQEFLRKLNNLQQDISFLCKVVHRCTDNPKELEDVRTQLSRACSRYDSVYKDYTDFLTRTKTADSARELEYITEEKVLLNLNVKKALTDIERYLDAATNVNSNDGSEKDSKSVKSSQHAQSKHSSHSSSKSSSIIAKLKAKAEAAKVLAKFAEHEAKLVKQKAQVEEQLAVETAKSKRHAANIDADLSVLTVKKEAAAVEAEAETLQLVYDDNKSQALSLPPPLSSEERTSAYVKQLEIVSPAGDIQLQPVCHELNPNANPYIPHQDSTIVKPSAVVTQGLDFTKFMLKKDLLFSRFTVFNEKPEFYPSWKNTFKNIIKDVQADSSEEIDLLLKWTGPQSKKYVESLKAANSSCPDEGLRLIWQRLDERYGSPELIEHALKQKICEFSKITVKDYKRLYDLADILSEIHSVKSDENYSAMFAYFDSSIGINPIVCKLPFQLQERWTRMAVDYNQRHKTIYPPFRVFVDFVHEQSRVRNNPCFLYEKADNTGVMQKGRNYPQYRSDVQSKKTELTEKPDDKRQQDVKSRDVCPIHNTLHSLNQCRTFKAKPLFERRRLLRQHKICFKCCASTHHVQAKCPVSVKCDVCGENHATAMHVKFRQEKYGGESKDVPISSVIHSTVEHNTSNQDDIAVSSKRTNTHANNFSGKSCAKIVLVNAFLDGRPDEKLRLYAIIDDQSNRTLAKSALFDYFGANGVLNYKLSTCSGDYCTSGRRLSNLVLESFEGDTKLSIPDILECNQIPEVPEEIPTRDIVCGYPHLRVLVDHIPPLDNEARILLLIGRDVIEAHHVYDQRIGTRNSPYAQKLALGWTVIGEVCLGKAHRPITSVVKKTHLLKDDRVSLLEPCSSDFSVREEFPVAVPDLDRNNISSDIFVRTAADDKPGLSSDDTEFLDIMSTSFQKDAKGNWSAPLPFRRNRQKLPNNRVQVVKRAKSLKANLRRDPKKLEHFLTFMKGIFDNGHAEPANELHYSEEQWFLLIFGIYHPKKPDQLRAVFDSSAKFDGVSLNDVLLTGPDLTNNLVGILLRFRRDAVAVMADIRQMFYCFRVNEEHRRYLKFLWYADNDFNNPLKEYMMTVQVFGNSPSPAIATYGLRKTAKLSESKFGSDVTQFVERDFYVDDGLFSLPTVSQAVDLMRRTRQALMTEGNLHLHKISSNKEEVISSFPAEDLAKGLKDLNLVADSLPVQRSLGMNWDLETDSFVFKIDMDIKPYTRRGILSTINSIYDPLGILAPVVIKGKIILRSLMFGTVAWDEPLPPEQFEEWDNWRSSLKCLEELKFPRMYVRDSFSLYENKTVHIYSDASEKAVAAVGYLQTDSKGHRELGFIMGKAKVAPTHGHTIPRLELCAAVVASDIGQIISEQLDIPLCDIKYYCDSKVVLGYIHNRTRRFYTYVSNRVAKIHQISRPEQWSFIDTDRNPADVATRSISSERLQESIWMTGSPCLLKQDQTCHEDFVLQNPDTDKEVRPDIVNMKVSTTTQALGSHRFQRFSSWKGLVEAIDKLKRFVSAKGSDNIVDKSVNSFHKAEEFVLRTVQEDAFQDELLCLKTGKSLAKSSAIFTLDPFIDESGLLRVGGRLKRANVSSDERNPIIIPAKHWISTLIVRFYHEKVKHQGRHFTSGAIRSAGYWIVGEKRLVSSILHKCVRRATFVRPVSELVLLLCKDQ